MAYTYILTNAAVTGTDPAGSDFISLGDDNIRAFKSAVIERVNSFFVDVNAQPWIIKSPGVGLGNTQSLIPAVDAAYVLGTPALRFNDVRTMLLTVTTTLTGGVGTFSGGLTGTAVTTDPAIFLKLAAANPTIAWMAGSNVSNGFKWIQDEVTTGDAWLVAINGGVDTLFARFTRATGGVNFLVGGVTVSGGFVVSTGNITVSAGSVGATSLVLTSAVSTIIPGATSLSHRNNANSADNLLITDAGLVTIRNDFTLSAGRLIFSATVSKIIPGATSISLRNNADSADNILINDGGNIVFRGSLSGAVNISSSGIIFASAGSATRAGLNVPHTGVAPSAPVDGDIWTTTAGMFVRVNGVTKSVQLV